MIICLFFLVACELAPEDIPPPQERKEETPLPETPPPEASRLEGKTSCEDNAGCDEGEECIDGKCGTMAELYKSDCELKCNFDEVIVSTSDGESYTLKKGQGSYTSAGALEWKIVSVPPYCPSEEIVVPIKILKKNYGKIISEQVITLKKGETSNKITHPTITTISFTVTLDEIKENCG